MMPKRSRDTELSKSTKTLHPCKQQQSLCTYAQGLWKCSSPFPLGIGSHIGHHNKVVKKGTVRKNAIGRSKLQHSTEKFGEMYSIFRLHFDFHIIKSRARTTSVEGDLTNLIQRAEDVLTRLLGTLTGLESVLLLCFEAPLKTEGVTHKETARLPRHFKEIARRQTLRLHYVANLGIVKNSHDGDVEFCACVGGHDE